MEDRVQPNILWYCSDAQRYDTIGALGNSFINTPRLDAIANHGVAFTRAYAQNTLCTPSRASFLTGRYPASHHVYRNGNAFFPKSETLVTKLLANAGYDCGLVGKLHLSTARAGERRPDDGYRVFNWSKHPLPDESAPYNSYYKWLKETKKVDPVELYADKWSLCQPGLPRELHQTVWCSEMAIQFITEARERPWLLSINPVDPHPPFDPPQEYLDRYDPAKLPPPLYRPSDLERQSAFKNVRHQCVTAMDPFGAMEGPEEVTYQTQVERGFKPPRHFNGQVIKAGYYGMIELIDDELGRIIDTLRETNQLENTLIIFHSDHGELLGDHGLLFKGARFFEGAVHVPLLFSWPGHIEGGLRSDALVELVDIAPTLLDAAGIDVPEFIQGQSLWPIVTGEQPAGHHKTHVVVDYYDSAGWSPVAAPTQATMTYDGRYKMAVYHRMGLGEIYDLDQDPGEFDNLWDEPSARELKCTLLQAHMDAVLATISPGPPRVAIW